jgi:hypothetical protein
MSPARHQSVSGSLRREQSRPPAARVGSLLKSSGQISDTVAMDNPTDVIEKQLNNSFFRNVSRNGIEKIWSQRLVEVKQVLVRELENRKKTH